MGAARRVLTRGIDWERALALIREPSVLMNAFLGVGILLGLSMLFPILHFIYDRWTRYPTWYDDLYLSIFWLDMSGNSLNLYNSVEWWDHIPHFHGSGALAMVLIGACALAPLAAAGLATMLHLALEIQEYYGDVLLGTHTVSGIADSINDLA